MIKTEFIKNLTMRQNNLKHPQVELVVNEILELMVKALKDGRRIEIRGFGSFSLRKFEAKTGRNPMTGAPVQVGVKYRPHFKPGKELRERVNNSV